MEIHYDSERAHKYGEEGMKANEAPGMTRSNNGGLSWNNHKVQ